MVGRYFVSNSGLTQGMSPGVAASTSPMRLAAALCGELWREVLLHGGVNAEGPVQYRHVPGLLSPTMVSDLARVFESERPIEQVVSLVDGDNERSNFDPQVGSAVEEAYRKRPRTQVFENLHEHGGWPLVATTKLMDLTGCRVVCKAFLSHPGDATFNEHVDLWYGLILQLHGIKRLQLRTSKDDEPVTVENRPGDALLLPEGVYHAVETPDLGTPVEENYSLHVQFALVLRKPL